MTQFPHDEFVKEYLPEFLLDYGEVTPSADVSSERRQIDVFFVPTKPVPTTAETLGLLGKLAQTTCLFEVYRNAVQSQQIRQCISKLLDVQHSQIKQAKKEARDFDRNQLAMLWIITPTISEEILSEFQAQTKPNGESGIYFLAPGLLTGIVAVHQLPVNKETLWLRILGKGKVQLRAIEELKALPANYPHRESILELIYGLLETLEASKKPSTNIDEQDRELIMSLRTVFREKLAQEKQQGIQQGIQQGVQQGIQQGLKQEAFLLVNRQLKRKLGELSPNLAVRLQNLALETLEALGEALLDFNSTSDLINWLETHSD